MQFFKEMNYNFVLSWQDIREVILEKYKIEIPEHPKDCKVIINNENGRIDFNWSHGVK